MSEIRKWLEAIGLGQYGDAFEANKIDMKASTSRSCKMPRRCSISWRDRRQRLRVALNRKRMAAAARSTSCANQQGQARTAWDR